MHGRNGPDGEGDGGNGLARNENASAHVHHSPHVGVEHDVHERGLGIVFLLFVAQSVKKKKKKKKEKKSAKGAKGAIMMRVPRRVAPGRVR
jgi:hypothetical protein